MTFSSAFRILVLGGNGYLGGAILDALAKNYPQAEITVLARSNKYDSQLLAAGATTVVHAIGNSEARRAASNADVVFNAADSDDIDLIKSLIDGLAERKRTMGIRGILIHTSGTALVFDDATGDFNSRLKPLNDNNEDDVASISPLAMHRNVDNEIFSADKAESISGYIIAPSIIWGEGRGPVKRVSGMFPIYLAMARAFERGIVIGNGTALAATVHIDDVVALHLLILARALAEQDLQSSPYSKFYFASTREQSQRDLLEPMAKYFFEKGIFPALTLEQISFEEAVATHPYALNTYVKAKRGIAIGWTPEHLESMTSPNELHYALDASLNSDTGVQKQHFGVSARV